eukprot:CAMPEP_0167775580 /NCGR_PEP_ID=MMETSP0111_2-20121227/2643_1 /TAXON_ID=91324 /ORGANISM="Lotharella globosa, Strain CCCM811" /LENGTH=329 /DNA_ID=CAMNT_0007665521 /DNA_START=139 /DNA_END=1125 /DNA_ORIENTATION=+
MSSGDGKNETPATEDKEMQDAKSETKPEPAPGAPDAATDEPSRVRRREEMEKGSKDAAGDDAKASEAPADGQPPPRRRRRKRGWDVGTPSSVSAATPPAPAMGGPPPPEQRGADAAARAAAMLKEQIAIAQAQQKSKGLPVDNPKQRELYVGNLQRGISGQMVQTFFNSHPTMQMFAQGGSMPCVRVQLDSGGTFAFVEFKTPDIATHALSLGGQMLFGRPLRTGRPRGYVDPSTGSVNDVAPANATDPNKKAREVYCGNITVGVTQDMLVTLFDQAVGPGAVVGCHMNDSGKFCFIEFKTADQATRALQLNGIDLVGRALRVGRPSGY